MLHEKIHGIKQAYVDFSIFLRKPPDVQFWTTVSKLNDLIPHVTREMSRWF
jgi:hypothetical protein